MKEQVFDNYSGTFFISFIFSISFHDTFVFTLGKVIFCAASSSSGVGDVYHKIPAEAGEGTAIATATAKTAVS